MSNLKTLIPKEQIAVNEHVPVADVKCVNCRFCNFFTVDIDTHTCHCAFWNKKMLCSSFCNNFTKPIKIRTQR